MNRKYFCILVALLCSFTVLCSCSTPDKTTTKDTKTVVLNEVAHSIFYAPMYVAIEKNYFKDEGIELELVTGFGADKTMTALLANEADIGFMGPESTIYTYQEGSTDDIINFAQLTQRAGNFLVSRDEILDFDWNMLADKTVIGGRTGGMPQMVFEYILKEKGMDPEMDLTIEQNIDFSSTSAAFTSGIGQFTIEFEPSATKLEQEGAGYVVSSLGVESGYVPYTAFCAKNSYIEENPEIVQGFTDAIQKGLDFCIDHTPEEIASVIQPQFSDTDLDTLTRIVARYYEQDTWKEDLTFSEESFDLLQEILESAGELNERVDYKALVNTEFASKATTK